MNSRPLREPLLLVEGAYGGSQLWFADPLRREDGCGAVAACNLLAALAAADGSRWGPLAPDGAGEKAVFLPWMDELYRRLEPGFFGCWSRRKWTARVLAYARERGVPLRPRSLSVRAGEGACRQLIGESLAAGRPVAALNLWKGVRDRYEYGWHWVTVTGLTGDELVFSSWGQRRTESWARYYRHTRKAVCKGGFVTFE